MDPGGKTTAECPAGSTIPSNRGVRLMVIDEIENLLKGEYYYDNYEKAQAKCRELFNQYITKIYPEKKFQVEYIIEYKTEDKYIYIDDVQNIYMHYESDNDYSVQVDKHILCDVTHD